MKYEDYISILAHAAFYENGVSFKFEFPEHAQRVRACLYRVRKKEDFDVYNALCFRIRGETLYVVKTERISKIDDGIPWAEPMELGLGDLYELPTWPSAKGRRS